MNLAVHYIGQAISGTGQNGSTEINTNKLHKYLQSFAKKFFGQAWRLWLRGVGLEKQEDVEAAVVEYLECYHKEVS